MYDIKKRKKLVIPTVGDVLEILEKVPRDAQILIGGCSVGYIHIESDDSVVSFDVEDLDEEYIDDPATSPEDYWENRDK